MKYSIAQIRMTQSCAAYLRQDGELTSFLENLSESMKSKKVGSITINNER